MKEFPKYNVRVKKTIVLGNDIGQRMNLDPGDIGTFQAVSNPSYFAGLSNANISPILIEAVFKGKKVVNGQNTGLIRFTPKGKVPNNDIKPILLSDGSLQLIMPTTFQKSAGTFDTRVSGADGSISSTGINLEKSSAVVLIVGASVLLYNELSSKKILKGSMHPLVLLITAGFGLVWAKKVFGENK